MSRSPLRASLAALGLAASVLATPAHAVLPTGTLTFLQPTGTASATDAIEVWLRLTLDATSVPLSISAGAPDFVTLADFNTPALQFLSIQYANTNIPFGCSGNFTSNCTTGTPYTFEFNTSSGPNSFFNITDINLAPGSSIDYLFGTFKPVGGVAPAGTYSFYSAYANIQVQGTGYKIKVDVDGNPVVDPVTGLPVYEQAVDIDGNLLFDTVREPVYAQILDGNGNPVFDANGLPVYEQAVDGDGNPLFGPDGKPVYVQALDANGDPLFTDVDVPRYEQLIFGSADIAGTNCGPDVGALCAGFTREVTAVPEPQTWALMAGGLLLLGVQCARRSAQRRASH